MSDLGEAWYILELRPCTFFTGPVAFFIRGCFPTGPLPLFL